MPPPPRQSPHAGRASVAAATYRSITAAYGLLASTPPASQLVPMLFRSCGMSALTFTKFAFVVVATAAAGRFGRHARRSAPQRAAVHREEAGVGGEHPRLPGRPLEGSGAVNAAGGSPAVFTAVMLHGGGLNPVGSEADWGTAVEGRASPTSTPEAAVTPRPSPRRDRDRPVAVVVAVVAAVVGAVRVERRLEAAGTPAPRPVVLSPPRLEPEAPRRSSQLAMRRAQHLLCWGVQVCCWGSAAGSTNTRRGGWRRGRAWHGNHELNNPETALGPRPRLRSRRTASPLHPHRELPSLRL